jgi:hypothetical protein
MATSTEACWGSPSFAGCAERRSSPGFLDWSPRFSPMSRSPAAFWLDHRTTSENLPGKTPTGKSYATPRIWRSGCTQTRSVSVTAEDAPALLVSWLNRLLLAQDVGGELYSRFKIYEISDRGLRAVAYGCPAFPQHTAIKAATYHDLAVARTGRHWTATVTFDV